MPSSSQVLQAIMFLASRRSGWVTGEVLFVTGGAHCGRTHMAPAAGRLDAQPAAGAR